MSVMIYRAIVSHLFLLIKQIKEFLALINLATEVYDRMCGITKQKGLCR